MLAREPSSLVGARVPQHLWVAHALLATVPSYLQLAQGVELPAKPNRARRGSPASL
jgi:hypothetical protein